MPVTLVSTRKIGHTLYTVRITDADGNCSYKKVWDNADDARADRDAHDTAKPAQTATKKNAKGK